MRIRWTGWSIAIHLVCLLSFFQITTASIGDRSPAYQRCRTSCIQDTCAQPPTLPLALRLTLWTCPDDCAYTCMHRLTDAVTSKETTFEEQQYAYQLEGLPPKRVVQFYGKWPFYRLFGIQEPLSVLFSLMNLFMHARYGLALKRRVPSDFPAPLARAYSVLPMVGINLWIWSSVFHTRDKRWTEKLDYFSSALNMMCNVFVAIVRLAGLFPPPGTPTSSRGSVARPVIVAILSVVFICHISYLSFYIFDYGYNMVFNVSLGLLHNLLWTGWTIYQSTLPPSKNTTGSRPFYSDTKSTRAPHFLRPFLVLSLLSACTMLELLDFPPIFRYLDAHALWHLATVPIVKWWYDCLLVDAWWICGKTYEGSVHTQRTELSNKERRLA